jgi:hypothetical protein
MGPDEQGGAAGRWLDVRQAADALGLSSDAVRKRIARGTLPSRKGEDGHVSVWLDEAGQGQDEDQPGGGTEAGRAQDAELVEELRDRVRYLERQLDVRTEELREHRRLLAGLIERMPELAEGPQEATQTGDEGGQAGAASSSPTNTSPDGTQSPAQHAEEASPTPTPQGPQTDVQRPWWRRILGG